MNNVSFTSSSCIYPLSNTLSESVPSDPLPELLKKAEARQIVTDFYQRKSEEFGQQQIEMLVRAEKILDSINSNCAIINPAQAYDNIRCLMWHADVAGILQVWASGGVQAVQEYSKGESMHSCPDREEKFFAYLFENAKATGFIYRRLSSHYRESVTGPQYGVDLEGLPRGLRTILFGKRKDKSTYCKLEHHGCPPFWLPKFCSLKNFTAFILHTLGFFRALGREIGIFKVGKHDREEKLDPRIKKLFFKQIKHIKRYHKQDNITDIHLHKLHFDAQKSVRSGVKAMCIFLSQNGRYNYLSDEGKEIVRRFAKRLKEDAERGTAHVTRQYEEIIHPFIQSELNKTYSSRLLSQLTTLGVA